MTKLAAIYHFTDESKQRPKIYRDQLDALKSYASSMGFDVTDTYCDMSLKRCERIEFNRFLENCTQYNALITKDFYHISKNTLTAISIMQELRDKGLKIYTIENGNFSWENAPFDKSLKIATYCCRFGAKSELHEIIPVQNDILTLFTTKKTNWTVVDQYFDESSHQNNGEQPQLMRLLENKDKYDLLMVHNLGDIHWRTANFCKIRERLRLDIYSLQDGFLQYRKESI